MSVAQSDISACVVGATMEIAIPWNDHATRENVRGLLRGRRWDGERKLWVVPLSPHNVQTLLNEFDLDEGVQANLREQRRAHKRKQAASSVLSVAKEGQIVIPGLRGSLRPFQQAGVQFAELHHGVLWADEQGLGKSVQSMATVEYGARYPAIIYCPDVLKLSWRRELNGWLPARRVAVLGVAKKFAGVPPEEADFVVLNYEIAKKHERLLISLLPKAVIADESHYLKNRKAQRTVSVTNLVEACAETLQKVMLLSGTPMLSRPVELASQLALLGLLDAEFGGFLKYAYRYCDAFRDRFGFHAEGASHLDELHARLRATCMVRRLKKDVVEELPDKPPARLVPVTMTNAAEYRKADTAFSKWLRDHLKDDAEFMAAIQHLAPEHQRLAMTERVQKSLRAETLAQRTALRVLAGKGKVAAAIAWIHEFHDANGDLKLLVFAHYRDVLRQLVQAFPGCLHILAEDSTSDRQGAVDAFQTDPAQWLFVLSTPAAQAGLTLHAASNELFVEYEDTVAAHRQAEDRAHRIGQKNLVNVYRLHVEGSVDDDLLTQITAKGAVADSVLDGQ